MNRFFSSAYTLIEVLVGLTIIGLIFGVGYINFRDFARRQAIAGAGKILQGDLRLAQGLALSGQKPDVAFCNSPNTLNSFDFRVFSTTDYRIEANCSGGSVISKEVFLPTGITISTPNPNPIQFKVLGRGTNIPSGTSIILTLTQASSNNKFTVTVGFGGEIQ